MSQPNFEQAKFNFSSRKSSTQPLPKKIFSVTRLIENSSTKSRDKFLNSSAKSAMLRSSTFHNCDNDESKLAIVLPYILDSDCVPIKQPILVRIDENQLRSFGFSLPFNDFFNVKMNNFVFEVKNLKVSTQIIAIAESKESLKENLKKNISKNQLWKDIRQVIGNDELVINLIHAPLEEDETPSQVCLSQRSIIELVNNISNREIQKNNEKDSGVGEKRKKSNSGENDNLAKKKAFDENQDDRMEKDASDGQDENNDLSKLLQISNNKNLYIEELIKSAKDLDSKKHFLNDKDYLSSTLILSIEVIQSLVGFVTKQTGKMEIYSMIPEKDETVVKRRKNRILIEGIVELELDKYERALIKVKSKDPGSVVYQLVHTAFPKCYYDNVALGKKSYDPSELEKYLILKEKSIEKLPLVFVLGFEDPFDFPLQGNFDQIRGQKRVKALIDHSFRKSGIDKYDDFEETKVRNRLIKELWSKNFHKNNSKTIVEKLDIEKDPNDQLSVEKLSQDVNLNSFSLSDDDDSFHEIWNEKVFKH